MKTVYIDITNIPKLQRYTGISRVVTEIVLRMIEERVNVTLLSYDDVRHAYNIISNEYFLLCAKGVETDKQKCYTEQFLAVEELEEGSVFFDMNSCWHTMPNRSWLLPRLKNKQIRIFVLIYDLIPIRHPQYMVGQTLMRFMEYLMAHLKYADDIIVNTQFVADDVRALMQELKLREKPIHLLNLGADFSLADNEGKNKSETVDPEIVRMLENRKFLLTVGTVEPRKNHKVLIEAYEKKLASMGIDVVIVGRIGWDMEPLLKRIQSNKKFNKGLYLLSGVNDATLNFLYRKAFMVIFSSYTEGYGLPTIEALINGIPVACSNIPVMREVGGNFCKYFDPDNADELVKIVEKYHNDPQKYQNLRERLRVEYRPPVWNDTVTALKSLLFSSLDVPPYAHKPVKQVVFLSARPAPILATLPHIEHFMPFITELVVCCPDEMAEYLHEKYKGRLKLTTVTDGELLNGRELPPDHSTRNFFLRCLAMQLDVLDEEFIMCDDDYRPLKPLTEEVFYKDGRYRGYYFTDITTWKFRVSSLFSYDYCHFRTLKFLRSNGYPTLQYSSHQPQIINKKWYRELIAKYPDIIRKGYDEWSTYFNYCAAEHPDQYEAIPYVTLSWPNIGGENLGVYQSDYLFENFYEENYAFGRPFAKFSKTFTQKNAIMEENEAKRLLAMKFRLEHQNNDALQDAFCEEYNAQYHEYPYVALYFSGEAEQPLDLGCPCRFTLSATRHNKIRIGISRSERTSMNICNAVLEICILDENEAMHFRRIVSIPPRLDYTFSSFVLPPTVPNDGRQLYLRITAHTAAPSAKAECLVPLTLV